jgi:hypothetical protein
MHETTPNQPEEESPWARHAVESTGRQGGAARGEALATGDAGRPPAPADGAVGPTSGREGGRCGTGAFDAGGQGWIGMRTGELRRKPQTTVCGS